MKALPRSRVALQGSDRVEDRLDDPHIERGKLFARGAREYDTSHGLLRPTLALHEIGAHIVEC